MKHSNKGRYIWRIGCSLLALAGGLMLRHSSTQELIGGLLLFICGWGNGVLMEYERRDD